MPSFAKSSGISAAVAALLSSAAQAGPITFSGNDSVETSALSAVTVKLAETEQGLAPTASGQPYQLSQIDAQKLSPPAINAILRAISELYQERGILATRAIVTVDGYRASQKGKPLRIKIIEGKIDRVAVVPADEDVPLSAVKRSRIEAAAPIGAGETISANELDGTVGLLNRFSRQQVRPVLVPQNGELVLEYRVKQLDEQLFSFAIDNYGSDRTGNERATLDYTQWNVFQPDDRFNFKAISSFEGNSNYFGADYMIPLDGLATSRLGFNVSYSNYTAEDIGLNGAPGLDFEGSNFSLGVNYERTLWNDKSSYLDGIVGLRLLDASQDQTSIGIPEASTQFLLPSIGVRYSKTTANSSLVAGAKLEANLASIAGTDSGLELSRQGRLFAEDSFVIGSAYAAYRTYLDEAITGDNGRDHELSILATATTSFGDRVAPSFLNVAGGYSTVRGYPLGASSGDSAFILKVDYTRHFKEILWGDAPVKMAATVFTDFAAVNNVDRLPFERDDTLLSVGVELEATINESLYASFGYGIALQGIDDVSDPVSSGDGDFYILVRQDF